MPRAPSYTPADTVVGLSSLLIVHTIRPLSLISVRKEARRTRKTTFMLRDNYDVKDAAGAGLYVTEMECAEQRRRLSKFMVPRGALRFSDSKATFCSSYTTFILNSHCSLWLGLCRSTICVAFGGVGCKFIISNNSWQIDLRHSINLFNNQESSTSSLVWDCLPRRVEGQAPKLGANTDHWSMLTLVVYQEIIVRTGRALLV